jgi:hypothetical protein
MPPVRSDCGLSLKNQDFPLNGRSYIIGVILIRSQFFRLGQNRHPQWINLPLPSVPDLGHGRPAHRNRILLINILDGRRSLRGSG